MGSVNAGCASVGPASHPAPTALATGAPTPLWRVHAGTGLTAPVAVDDTLLFVAGYDRKVSAVDLRTGVTRWSSRLPGVIVGGVLHAGALVYAASGRPEGRVVALRAATGRRAWKTATDNVIAPLAIVSGTLVVQTRSGGVLGLDAMTGAVRWRRRVGAGRAPPFAVDSTALIATLDSLVRMQVTTGHVVERRRSPGTVLSGWCPAGDALVAGTTDSLVIAIGAHDLVERWRAQVDAPVVTAPVRSGDSIFVITRIGTLYRVELSTGAAVAVVALHWPVTGAPAVVGNLILVGGADGNVRALRHDGSEAWRLALYQPIEIAPLAVEGGVLTFDGNGDIARYRL